MRFPQIIAITSCLSLAGLVAPASSRADSLTTNFNFITSNQSIWTGGSVGAHSYTLFNVNNSVNGGGTFGPGISDPTQCFGDAGCISLGKTGFSLTAAGDAMLGADLVATLDGGSIAATVPLQVSLGFPQTVTTNTPFSVTSKGQFEAGAHFDTTAPNVKLSLGLSGMGALSLSAELCGFNQCTNDGVGGIGSFKVTPLDNFPVIPQGPLSLGPLALATERFPFTSTHASNSGNQSANAPLFLQSQGSVNFLTLNADLANLMGKGLGIPTLNGNLNLGGVGNVGYSLFNAGAQIGLQAIQNFSLQAQPSVAYQLNFVGSHPGMRTTGAMLLDQALPLEIPAGDTAVEVTPIYSMHAELADIGEIDPTFNLFASGLSFNVNVPDVSFNAGPLFSQNFNVPIPAVPVFSNGFALQGWKTFTGQRFLIRAQNSNPGPVPTPEPASLLLLGTGMLLGGLFLRRWQAA